MISPHMKNRRGKAIRNILCSLLALAIHLNALADNAVGQLAQYARWYQQYNLDYAQEKVYLHFDNSSYYLGEDIWFKAYVVLAGNHHFTPLSKTLYVELLTPAGNLVQSLKLRVTDGQAQGVFYLGDLPTAGFYEVRAYTRCMLNYGSDVVFSRVIPVFDAPQYESGSSLRLPPKMSAKREALPDKRPSAIPETRRAKRKATEPVNVDFYPEGGHLIANQDNLVAFSIYSDKGEFLEAQGTIVDEQGETVMLFQSEYEGRGQFVFHPETGKSYSYRLTYQGKNYSQALPTAENQGLALHLQERDGRYRLKIANQGLSSHDTLAIAITCRGRLSQFSLYVPTREAGELNFHAGELYSGVNELTVYNPEGRVLASRLFFVRHGADDPEAYHFDYAFDKEDYKPFEAVRMKFHLTEGPDSTARVNAADRHFSLAIRDGYDSFSNAREHSILSDMLLSSDLKGYIHRPASYFESDDALHRHRLDLLMLVQGWKRYDWQAMSMGDTLDIKHPIEDGVLLRGQVLSVPRRKPISNLSVLMWMLSDSSSYHGTCLTDEKGYYDFLFDIEGDWKLSLQISDGQKRKNGFITVDRQFQPALRDLTFYEEKCPSYEVHSFAEKKVQYNSSDYRRGEITIMPGDVLLKEVEVEGKQQNDNPNNVSITYEVAKEMDALEDQAEFTYSEIPYFLVQINPNFHFVSNDSSTEILYYRHARVQLVNMLRVGLAQDEEDLATWLVQDIERMEIIEPGTRLSTIEDFDISTLNLQEDMKDVAYVLLYPYKDGRQKEPPMGIRQTTLKGYNVVKEFYHPIYDRAFLPDSHDHRRTLYWNPDLSTDDKGEVEVKFYNNATATRFTVDAETMDAKGRMGFTN